MAKTVKGRAAVQLIADATTRPGLFAFGELLDMPNIQALQGTEHAPYFELLRLFCHGTWADYKASVGLPPLDPQQTLKLKQLTIVSLAENAKILPYDVLITQLDVSNVRELEDLLINDCMYTGIVRGKLDQRQRCFEVHYAAGRDIRPGQLASMLKVLNDWVKTSEELMQNVEQKVMWAGNMVEEHNARKLQIEAQIEETKKTIKPDPECRGAQESYLDADMPMEEDRTGGRSKRRR